MIKRQKRDIVHRWEGNPIVNLDVLSFSCNNIYNAGAVKIGNEYILLVAIENLEGKTSIYKAVSENGYHFNVEDKPFMVPSDDPRFITYEKRGIRDARITFIDGIYYIVYLGASRHGILLCLATTTDFKSIKRHGVISEPETKAGALFPCKFNNSYARLERPREGGSVWISRSNDLLTWGQSEVVLSPRAGFWDSDHVGCAVPPFEIDSGWLLIYYGVKKTASGYITRMGAAILDKENPGKVIARSNIPILSPRETYERIGDTSNLIFSTGAVLEDNNELKLYYGAADNCLCAGTVKLKDIYDTCMESMREF